ncbi:TNFAIP3-interacting protein 3-like [Salarias fasciatus]|uniref:TNFAIP3-interacting protein 3-like n=1 Tax=Salarias fasciatus TaxID=181472 RepID=UPI001176AE4C|nr:TNFAIP3-interacting protein 3-like [Salarias fasciatus]
MSLRENSKDGPPVETTHSTENLKKVRRLYPSLPNVDGYDFCEVENLRTSAAFPPDSPQEITQSGESPPCSDVRLKAQILFLEEQRKQLLSINEKWAKEYRTMVRYYKDKIRVVKASQEHEEKKHDEGQKNITLVKDQKVRLVIDEDNLQTGESSSELLKAKTETEELRLQNRTLTRRGQHQQEEIRRLNKALEKALQTSQSDSVSSEDSANIWKHQAEVYKEDFCKERKDREKLKEKYLELEKRFRKVYSELRVLKSQVTLVLKPQPAVQCPCNVRDKNPNWEICKVNQHYIQEQRRHALSTKE